MTTYPALKVGTKVLTVETNHTSKDWDKKALASRRFGVVGTIIHESNSHGLCFKVEHEDGSIGYYDPWELDSIPE